MSKAYHLTNSEWTSRSCLQFWFMRYGIGVELKGEKPRVLRVGSLWAHALEGFWIPNEDGYILPDRVSTAFRFIDEYAEEKFSDTEENKEVVRIVKGMIERYDQRWLIQNDNLRVVWNEDTFALRLRAPSGNYSNLARGAGRVDRVLRDEFGMDWLKESKHKSKTLIDPSKFREQYEHDLQTLVYAWAYRESTGIQVAGIMLDGASGNLPTPGSSWGTLKNETGLYKTIPGAFATTETLHEALELNGFSFGDQEWHAEVESDLAFREKGFFHREWIPVEPEQIDRVGDELYWASTRTRRDHAVCRDWRKEIARCFEDQDPNLGLVIESAMRDIGPRFPRNGSQCSKWGRPCDYTDVCWDRSAAVNELTVRPSIHSELQENSDATSN